MTADPILDRLARMQQDSDQRARRALGIPADDTLVDAPDEGDNNPDWLRKTLQTTTAHGRITNNNDTKD